MEPWSLVYIREQAEQLRRLEKARAEEETNSGRLAELLARLVDEVVKIEDGLKRVKK